MKALLGKKIGMTQVFSEDALIPVTVVEAGPCVITQVKSKEKEGYEAVQIGYEEAKEKKVNKPMMSQFKKAKVKPVRHLAEYRLKKGEEPPQAGVKIGCDIFEVGELADVSAVSKGKGFQGVIKRWGFSGGPGGHGSHLHRGPGSIGMAATPSRVLKGMKMAGQMGNKKVTVKNLEIVKVDPDQNIILVKGAVPGGKGAILIIEETGRKVKAPVKLIEQVSEEKAAEKDEKKEKVKSTDEKATKQKDEKVEQKDGKEAKKDDKQADGQKEKQAEKGKEKPVDISKVTDKQKEQTEDKKEEQKKEKKQETKKDEKKDKDEQKQEGKKVATEEKKEAASGKEEQKKKKKKDKKPKDKKKSVPNTKGKTASDNEGAKKE